MYIYSLGVSSFCLEVVLMNASLAHTHSHTHTDRVNVEYLLQFCSVDAYAFSILSMW